MSDVISLPHWTLGDPLPKPDDPKFERALGARLQATHENFEELVSQTAKQLAGAFQQRVPPGEISMFASASAPTGYLLCDGSAVSRVTYADLFDVAGTSFGAGDGSTTFNLPNLNAANRFPRGSTAVGGTGGAASHTHTMGAASAANNFGSGGGAGAETYATDLHEHTVDSESSLPPYLNLVYIIKT